MSNIFYTDIANITSLTASVYGTSSYAESSIYALTASYALSGVGGSGLTEGDTYLITSSWANSSSYTTGSIFNANNPALSSSYAESSSYALSSSYGLSSSYALTASEADISSLVVFKNQSYKMGIFPAGGFALDLAVNTPTAGGQDTTAEGVDFFIDTRGTYGLFTVYHHWSGSGNETFPFQVSAKDTVNIGSFGQTSTSAVLYVKGSGSSSGNIPTTIADAYSGQTADILQCRDSDGAPLFRVDIAGNVSASAYTSSLTSVGFYGTSSWAESSSYASTASYITGSIFDANNPVLSSSYASTSSYAPNYLPLTGGTISGTLYQSGTFFPDQIDWFSSSIGNDTGSYILTTTTNGLTTYANYQDVASALAPYVPTVSSSVSASYSETASHVTTLRAGGTVDVNSVQYNNSGVLGGNGKFTFDGTSVFIGNGGTLNATGSILGTSSYANQALSSSYALTASHALNGGTGTSQWTTVDSAVFYDGQVSASGYTSSLTSVGFYGTSSWAVNAASASFVTASDVIGTVANAQTASYLVPTNNYNITNLTATGTSSLSRLQVGVVGAASKFAVWHTTTSETLMQAGYNPGPGTVFQVSGSGVFAKIAAGTVAAPSIEFLADADGTGTGIYRSAANSLGISCNGANVGTFSTIGLNVVGDITASRLNGTASWAANASTASMASTASYALSSSRIDGITLGIKNSSVITTGEKGRVIVSNAGYITGWQLISKESTNLSLSIWKANKSNPTSGNNICSTDYPTLSSEFYSGSTSIPSWTSSLNYGDILVLNVINNSASTDFTLKLDTVYYN